jgi:hypothetical protein
LNRDLGGLKDEKEMMMCFQMFVLYRKGTKTESIKVFKA